MEPSLTLLAELGMESKNGAVRLICTNTQLKCHLWITLPSVWEKVEGVASWIITPFTAPTTYSHLLLCYWLAGGVSVPLAWQMSVEGCFRANAQSKVCSGFICLHHWRPSHLYLTVHHTQLSNFSSEWSMHACVIRQSVWIMCRWVRSPSPLIGTGISVCFTNPEIKTQAESRSTREAAVASKWLISTAKNSCPSLRYNHFLFG